VIVVVSAYQVGYHNHPVAEAFIVQLDLNMHQSVDQEIAFNQTALLPSSILALFNLLNINLLYLAVHYNIIAIVRSPRMESLRVEESCFALYLLQIEHSRSFIAPLRNGAFEGSRSRCPTWTWNIGHIQFSMYCTDWERNN
jgi:hypothetical protein